MVTKARNNAQNTWLTICSLGFPNEKKNKFFTFSGTTCQQKVVNKRLQFSSLQNKITTSSDQLPCICKIVRCFINRHVYKPHSVFVNRFHIEIFSAFFFGNSN